MFSVFPPFSSLETWGGRCFHTSVLKPTGAAAFSQTLSPFLALSLDLCKPAECKGCWTCIEKGGKIDKSIPVLHLKKILNVVKELTERAFLKTFVHLWQIT